MISKRKENWLIVLKPAKWKLLLPPVHQCFYGKIQQAKYRNLNKENLVLLLESP